MGITISHAWYRTTLNNNHWHKSWERHIEQLEGQMSQCKKGAAHIIPPLKPSNSMHNSLMLNQTFNLLLFGFWCILPIISLLKFFYYFVYVNGTSLSLVSTLFLCIPFLIMMFLSIALNVFMCMFSSKDDAELDNKELDISLRYNKSHHS
ncbi:hypothetical protein [Budvicia diplopodorum]|uniref:hypothetical protein n=1 Tax=Budvicia diplopodorum TaxID=1119056 RepID=UPI00135953B2|nr:hypothetical protein [Budvicia diplopodorum]